MTEEDQNFMNNMMPILKKGKNEPKIKEMAYKKILYFANKNEPIPVALLPFLKQMHDDSIKLLGSTYKPTVTRDYWSFKTDCVDLLVCICGYKKVDALKAIKKRDEAKNDFYPVETLRRKRNDLHKNPNHMPLVLNCKEFKSVHSKNKKKIEEVILNSSSTIEDITKIMFFG